MSVTLLNRAVDAVVARARIRVTDVEGFARVIRRGGGVTADELSAFAAIATRHGDFFDAAARERHATLTLSLAKLPPPPAPARARADAAAVVSWDNFSAARRPDTAAFVALAAGLDSPVKRAALEASFNAGSPLSELQALASAIAGFTDARVEHVLAARGAEQLAERRWPAPSGSPAGSGRFDVEREPRFASLDATAKGQLAAVLEADGFATLTAAEQDRFVSLLCGANRIISEPARQTLARFVRMSAFVSLSTQQQAAELRAQLQAELWLPANAGALMDLSTHPAPRLSGPVAVASHVFVEPSGNIVRQALPAMRYDVELDGRTVPLFVGAPEPAPGELRHSPEVVARALAALPKVNRDLVGSVKMHSHRNPSDAWWERTFDLPGFRSLMTAGDNAAIDIYPVAVNGTSAHQLLPAMIHETGHFLSTRAWGANDDARWYPWRAVSAADGISASRYARENWREDVSETLTLLERVRGTAAEAEVRAMMPGKIKLLESRLT